MPRSATEMRPCFSGPAEITPFESPVEELTRLTPIEMIGGYFRTVGLSRRAGTTRKRITLK